VGIPEVKRSLGRARHSWIDNMKVGLGRNRLGGGGFHPAQNMYQFGAAANMVMNLGREGRRSKHNCLSILFIKLTTCFGHCGPSSGHKNVY